MQADLLKRSVLCEGRSTDGGGAGGGGSDKLLTATPAGPHSLPVPWLLYSVLNGLRPVPVSSNGLFCAIVLLFLMLLFVLFSIASCKWRMNKVLGLTMFLLYFVFLVISVLLEDRIISCPVSV